MAVENNCPPLCALLKVQGVSKGPCPGWSVVDDNEVAEPILYLISDPSPLHLWCDGLKTRIFNASVSRVNTTNHCQNPQKIEMGRGKDQQLTSPNHSCSPVWMMNKCFVRIKKYQKQ